MSSLPIKLAKVVPLTQNTATPRSLSPRGPNDTASFEKLETSKSIFSPNRGALARTQNFRREIKAFPEEADHDKLNFDSVTLEDLKNFYKKNLVRDIETSLQRTRKNKLIQPAIYYRTSMNGGLSYKKKIGAQLARLPHLPRDSS